MKIEKLTYNVAKENRETLVNFYYKNSKDCCFMESFRWEDAEAKIDSMLAHMQDGSAKVYGCLQEGALLGYLWAYRISFRDEDRVYVSEVHVAESQRGAGIGRLLLAAVEEDARTMEGVTALYLHTEATNEGAIRLYEKEGYRLERVQMRKALNKD